MSAFERKRLENIAANNALLSEISTTAAKIIPKPEPPKPAKRTSTRTKREPVKREPARPTRQSSRLAGLSADPETLKRKAEVEAEAEAEKAKAKRMRVNEDLNLGDIQVEGRKWENGLDGLAGLKGLSVRGAQPGVRTFTEEDVNETKDEGLKNLRLRMSSLKLYEKWPVQGMAFIARLQADMRWLTRGRHQDSATTRLLPGLSPHRVETNYLCRRQRGCHGRIRRLPGACQA